MLKVKDKVTNLWQNHYLEKFVPYTFIISSLFINTSKYVTGIHKLFYFVLKYIYMRYTTHFEVVLLLMKLRNEKLASLLSTYSILF